MFLLGVSYILHVGMPQYIEEFLQEAGRAGRDGKQCFSVLFTLPKGRASGFCNEYRESKGCLRDLLSSYFPGCYQNIISHL